MANEKQLKNKSGSDIYPILNNMDVVALHNNIYRGKNLTNIYTIDQISAKIAAGTFDDLYIGDYIVVNVNGTNRNLRFAGFDTYLNTGDTSLTSHHIVIVPDYLGTAPMNDTNVTTGGFKGSKMWTETLPTWQTYFENALGASHIISYRQLITNSVSNGISNGWEWISTKLSLMSEVNVYGSVVFGSGGYDVGIDNRQIPLFRLNPAMINIGKNNYWLKGVRSASTFCCVYNDGRSTSNSASYARGVRPLFLIK